MKVNGIPSMDLPNKPLVLCTHVKHSKFPNRVKMHDDKHIMHK